VTIHYFIYSPLKYKDDGRDIVSFIDFVTIHVTFPAINAWITYFLYYTIIVTVTTVCDSNGIFTLVISQYCSDYTDKTGDEKTNYFYYKLFIPSQIAFILLFVEASINLTYYKDCVFAVTVLSSYLGMLWVNLG